MNHDNSRSGNCMTAVAVLLLLLLMVALASSGIRKICDYPSERKERIAMEAALEPLFEEWKEIIVWKKFSRHQEYDLFPGEEKNYSENRLCLGVTGGFSEWDMDRMAERLAVRGSQACADAAAGGENRDAILWVFVYQDKPSGMDTQDADGSAWAMRGQLFQ